MKKAISWVCMVVMIITAISGMCYANTIVMISSAKMISPPDRTTYVAGEKFDPTGLVVQVTYTNGHKVNMSSGFPDKYIEEGDKEVVFSFSGYSVKIPIKTITKSSQNDVVRGNISIASSHVVYISGYDDGTFKPNKTLTRAEAVTMLCKIVPTPPANTKSSTYKTPFADVTTENWFYPYVGYLYKNGVIAANDGNLFKPNEPISRAEFAVYASRFKKYTESKKQVFSDVKPDYWAAEEINAVFENGWISGYSDGTFKPERSLTRAQAATIINGMMDRSIDASSIVGKNVRYFSDVASNHWAYYSIIEAATEHKYHKDYKTGMEIWD